MFTRLSDAEIAGSGVCALTRKGMVASFGSGLIWSMAPWVRVNAITEDGLFGAGPVMAVTVEYNNWFYGLLFCSCGAQKAWIPRVCTIRRWGYKEWYGLQTHNGVTINID